MWVLKLVVWADLTSTMNLLVVHETLKPQGFNSAGISYLFLYMLIFFFLR